MISTYRQVNFSALSHLFGENAQEVEDASVALGAVAQGLHDSGEHIVPVLHLDRENRQTNAELNSDGLGASSVLFELQENLVSKGREFGWWHLGRQVVGNL